MDTIDPCRPSRSTPTRPPRFLRNHASHNALLCARMNPGACLCSFCWHDLVVVSSSCLHRDQYPFCTFSYLLFFLVIFDDGGL